MRINILRVLNVDEGSDAYWATPEFEENPVKIQIDMGSRASIISNTVYQKFMKHLSLRSSDTVL